MLIDVIKSSMPKYVLYMLCYVIYVSSEGWHALYILTHIFD